VVEPDPEQVEFEFQGDPSAAAGFAGEDGAVVGEHRSRDAVAAEGAPEAGQHVVAGGGVSGVGGDVEAGVVVIDVEDLGAVPSASCQWVVSACQRSLGMAAQNRVPAPRSRAR